MTASALMGTILAVQRDDTQTILRVATGSNGTKRQDNVILPGRRDTLTSGRAVKLINFIRDEHGSLVPGENAKLTLTNLATRGETTPHHDDEDAHHHESEPSPVSSREHTPAQERNSSVARTPALKPQLASPASSAPTTGLMVFSDRSTRQAVFSRAVDVAREFAEHIRKSGQIIKIQGRDYVTVAGWSLLPAFESANCYTVSHQVQPDGTVIAEAILEKDGRMVSRGFGACSDKERPKINDRLAMAQTRARGSALKARYSVLVTLAGYEASLADEVEESQHRVASALQTHQSTATPIPPAPTPSTPPLTRPTKEQIEFALKMFDGDRQALLKEATALGLMVFQVEDILTPVLKKIVEKRVNDRKRERADAAASTPPTAA